MKEKKQVKSNKLLKTVNKDIINYLKENKVLYTIEKTGDLEIYGFLVNEEIEDYINSTYSANDFFFEKRLRF